MSVELALVFRDNREMLYAAYGRILYLDYDRGYITVKDVIGCLGESREHLIYALILELNKRHILTVAEEHLGADRTIYRLEDMEGLRRLVEETDVIIRHLDELEDRILRDSRYFLMGNVPDGFRSVRRVSLTEIIPIFSGLCEMISEAEEEVLILNPFFDSNAVGELKPVLVRAMDRKVTVRIITRYVEGKNMTNLEALNPLIECLDETRKTLFRLYRYQSDSRSNGTFPNFHAKMVVIDRIKKAYIGSANLTEYGLGDRLELGVRIEGRAVQILYELIEYLIREEHVKPVRLD